LRRTHHRLVTLDFEAGGKIELADGDGQFRKTRFERCRARFRSLRTVGLASLPRSGGNLKKLAPGAGRSTDVLVAIGQVDERSPPGLDALAFFQFGARLDVAALPHQPARFIEERLRGRSVSRGSRSECGAR
jgi:hypothetical protein